jgi:hypothetical protein
MPKVIDLLLKSIHIGFFITHCKSTIHKKNHKKLLHQLLCPNAALDLLKICEQCNATWGIILFTDLSICLFVISLPRFLPNATPISLHHLSTLPPLSLTRSWSLLVSNQGSRSSILYLNLHSKVGVTQEINFPGILITLTCLSLFKFYNFSLSVFSRISFLGLFFVLVGVRVLGSHLETHLAVDFLLWSWLEA